MLQTAVSGAVAIDVATPYVASMQLSLLELQGSVPQPLRLLSLGGQYGVAAPISNVALDVRDDCGGVTFSGGCGRTSWTFW